MTLSALASRWTDEASALEKWGDSRGALILSRCATELDLASRAHASEALTISQAAAESGYSCDHLRALVSTGEVANAGRKGSPRIRRRDLPMKPGHVAP